MHDPHRLDLVAALPPPHRERLLQFAEPVRFPGDTRVFREGQRADHFWTLRSGAVRLDLQVPTHPPVVLETLHRGDLLGWSWLFPPYEWQFGARTEGAVTAWEFDAVAVRELCEADPAFAQGLLFHVARVIAHRLVTSRMRLLHMYGPYGFAESSKGLP